MAIRPRLVKQMPWVGTVTQASLIERVANERNISKAEVVRDAFDYMFGLVDGELPPKLTLAEAAEYGMRRLREA